MQRQTAGVNRPAGAARLSVALAMALLVVKGEPADATPEEQCRSAVSADLPIRARQRDGPGGSRPARRAGGLLQSRRGGPLLPGAHGPEPSLHERKAVASRAGRRHELRLSRRSGRGRRRSPGSLSWKGPTRIEAAFYGYRSRFDLGEQPRCNERGEVVGTLPSADASNNVGVSLALRSFVEVGVGATSKWISSDFGGWEGSARAHDYGIMAVAPVDGLLKRLTGRELALGAHLGPRLDIGYGIAWHNRGSRIAWRNRGSRIAAEDDPLPANRRQRMVGQPCRGLAIRCPPDHDRESDPGDGDLPPPDRGRPRSQAVPRTTRGDGRCRSSRRSPSAEASTTTSMGRST